MKKIILLIGLIVLSSIIAKSQTTVITDDSTYTPTSANAIFEVFSQNNNKGILIPRLTTAQRTTIATAGTVDQSLMVFDTDTKTFWYFDGAAWVEMATGGTVSDNQNIDSLTLNGLTLTTYIENGNSAFVDLTAISDSAISYIINNSDTLFSSSTFNDSIISIINNNFDTLFLNQSFIDSLTSVIYNQGDTLLYNQTFINALQDSIDTDIDNAYLIGNTLNIDENGNTVSVDLSTLVNDADSDPTNEIELPATAVNGQVLTWNGTDWVAQNPGSGADNWGTQVVVSDGTLDGDGTSANPLTVNSTATDNQNISGSGLSGTTLTIGIENGSNETVDLSSLQDGTGTDDQNIQGCGLSGTTLTVGIENGNSQTVDLSSLQDGTGTDDQNLTGATLTGTSLQIDIENGNSTTVDLSSLQDGTGTDDQNIQGSSVSGNNLIIGIENGSSQTVDMSHFMDNTDNQALSISNHTISLINGGSVTVPDNDTQDLSLSGNTLSLTDGGSVNLATITSNNAWNLTGNSGTTTSNFIGTTDNVELNFRMNNEKSGKIATNKTFFGYQAGNVSTGTNNAFFGDGAGVSATTADENVFVGHHTGYGMKTGNSNTAIGYNAFYNYGGAGGSHPGGNGNIAVGKWAMFNPTSGDYNVAVGYSAFSLPNSGGNNVFIGYMADRDNNSSVSNAIGIGAYSNSDADEATAIGYRAYANQTNSLILGQTTNDGNPNNATANTNVGINTLTPETSANITLGAMDGSNEGGQITWYGADTHDTWRTDLNVNDFRIFSYSSNNNALRIFNYGSGVTDLIVDGGQGYAVAWNTTSDKRIKTEVKNINYGLKTILALKPVIYNKHQVKKFENGQPVLGKATKEIGLLAQDLYKIIPEIVHKPKDDSKELWAVDYSKLAPVLIKAVQEQEQKIEEQQNTINKLQQQNTEILERLKKLENK